ncbi:hypothetical protein [uncultured Flavobacterium sp.]|uniref:hypothetical protein n=1 Tax=uncultured Flavobacterium sp. TaxID=165435 RepID=UPI0025F10529|nr:hypothetical protein [uncultured Flavobacterium sp.]
MKTKIFHTALLALLSIGGMFAQDVTTVRANSDISDNLDLKAVASIFGDSRDLEDFERRLNDPDIQISNLDLNGDNRVDYLRVIETAEGNTHLIVLQAVLGIDTFQDVATIELERDRNNNVQVQVVGDVYMYGANYIYEPVYVSRPVLFDVFWVSSYRPYYSPWYWGYYPRYYSYWAPYPVYRYRNNCHVHINSRNTYTYVNTRRSTRAVSMYSGRRSNAWERQNPNRGFSTRNSGVSNRYALEQSRTSTRSQSAGSSRSSFTNTSSRSLSPNTVRSTNVNTVRSSGSSTRGTSPSRSVSAPSRQNDEIARPSGTPSRNGNTTRSQATVPSRVNTQPSRNSAIDRNSAPAARSQSTPRSSSPSMSTPAPSRSNSVSPSRSSSNNSSMRSTPAPSRQSAPSHTRSGGNSRRG